ncbi:MAG: hypothetical protein ABL904_00655 [Hyphomicrobiaceae bacterium]
MKRRKFIALVGSAAVVPARLFAQTPVGAPVIDQAEDDDDWKLWWDARLQALEGVLGKAEEVVGHAPVPLYMGPEVGGAADLLYFRNHVTGSVSVTADLIGYEALPRNAQGFYELMICHRDDDAVGPNIISNLANYTLQVPLQPGETMDISRAVPAGATTTAFMFCDYARFKVREKESGLLLCIGITLSELSRCRAGHGKFVEAQLRSTGVFPFTDWYRPSVAK